MFMKYRSDINQPPGHFINICVYYKNLKNVFFQEIRIKKYIIIVIEN